MRVKMLVTESGRHPDCYAGTYHCIVGQEYSMPDDLAKRWVAAGVAKKVRVAKPKKTAAKKAAETKETTTTEKGVKDGD